MARKTPEEMVVALPMTMMIKQRLIWALLLC